MKGYPLPTYQRFRRERAQETRWVGDRKTGYNLLNWASFIKSRQSLCALTINDAFVQSRG